MGNVKGRKRGRLKMVGKRLMEKRRVRKGEGKGKGRERVWEIGTERGTERVKV